MAASWSRPWIWYVQIRYSTRYSTALAYVCTPCFPPVLSSGSHSLSPANRQSKWTLKSLAHFSGASSSCTRDGEVGRKGGRETDPSTKGPRLFSSFLLPPLILPPSSRFVPPDMFLCCHISDSHQNSPSLLCPTWAFIFGFLFFVFQPCHVSPDMNTPMTRPPAHSDYRPDLL